MKKRKEFTLCHKIFIKEWRLVEDICHCNFDRAEIVVRRDFGEPVHICGISKEGLAMLAEFEQKRHEQRLTELAK